MVCAIYNPQTVQVLTKDLHRVPFTDSRRIRWVLAARLVITLEEIAPVTDLDALTERELELIRVSR
ncbi:hypothetical protein [Streptomyces sp. NPDC051132]|uniref:hypothetical protein n=1 Tax=unclassified Streptomyces TaxID=2593676 RepID=UPI00343DE7E4